MNFDLEKHKFAMVSEWMIHGNINDFVKVSGGVNRVQLVGEDATP